MNARSILTYAVNMITIVCALGPTYAHGAHVRAYEGDFDLRIPAEGGQSKGWMTPAIIEVPDHQTLLDLDVTIHVEHTKVFDLQIFLESPQGTRLLLNMYDPFADYFEGEDYQYTTFDDEASLPIEFGQPPFEGRFRPMQGSPLSVFDGEDTFGPWELQVYDAFHADIGRLEHFELTFTVPEPASGLILCIGVLLLARRR